MTFTSLLQVVQHCDKQPYEINNATVFQHQGVIIGHILPNVLDALKVYEPSPFDIDSNHVRFTSEFDTFDKRTEAIKTLLNHWRQEKTFDALSGWRDELYPVYGKNETLFVMERAAASLFGVLTFGVHLNAFVKKYNQVFVWVGQRSKTKQTYPGMLDNCVAGGIPYGYRTKETIIKECEEEASIPSDLSSEARSVSLITYYTYSKHGLKPETQYIYDLELPHDFKPKPQDGEAECFYLWSLEKIKETILNNQWKPNCAAVMIEFMMRHGFITPDNEADYIQISFHLHRRLELPTPSHQ